MKKPSFRAVVIGTAIISGVLTGILALLSCRFPAGWLLSLAITCGTTFYHFAMRLLVGSLIPARFDYRKSWFQEKPFEKALYRKLGLRRWKGNMPTYQPKLFSLEHYPLEEIIAHMCQAEVVHEVIALCSFLPLFFTFLWGDFLVFLLTSLAAACFDMLFVMLQRYNRPRLVRLLEKQRRKGNSHV